MCASHACACLPQRPRPIAFKQVPAQTAPLLDPAVGDAGAEGPLGGREGYPLVTRHATWGCGCVWGGEGAGWRHRRREAQARQCAGVQGGGWGGQGRKRIGPSARMAWVMSLTEHTRRARTYSAGEAEGGMGQDRDTTALHKHTRSLWGGPRRLAADAAPEGTHLPFACLFDANGLCNTCVCMQSPCWLAPSVCVLLTRVGLHVGEQPLQDLLVGLDLWAWMMRSCWCQ